MPGSAEHPRAEHQQGNHDRAAAILEEALGALRGLSDRQLIAWALSYRGMVAHDLGNLEHARAILEESLSLAREVGNKLIIAWALTQLADVLHSQGMIELALPLLDEGISLWRAINTWGLAPAIYCRGEAALTSRDFERASALFRESLQLWSKLGTRRGVADSLDGLGGLALAQWNPARAARLYGAAEAIRGIGAPRLPRRRAAFERNLVGLRRELGEDGFTRAWAEGEALRPERLGEER